MYANILVPTDGSDAVDAALEHALSLARTYGATVHALYVVEPIYTVTGGFEQVEYDLHSYGSALTSEIAESVRSAGLTASTAIRTGIPHREILEYTEKADIDLIVMGTRGRRGIERYLLGSTTERIIRLAEPPVFTVHAPPA